MSVFILLPGAGGAARYWHRVVPLLAQAGHEAIAVELPGDNPEAGLGRYADLVIEAMGARPRVTLVAQSMGAFTAAVVGARVPAAIERLVFTNAMIPLPGETAGAWWENTGWEPAREAAARRGGYGLALELPTYFFHDLPADVAADLARYDRDEAPIAFEEPAAFGGWPPVPIHAVAGKDDRLFPVEFQAHLVQERLGLEVDVLPGGHLMALSYPRELAAQLLAYGTSG